MKILKLALAVSILLTVNAKAQNSIEQNATYTGQVFDSKSKQPLSFVNIGIPSKGVGTVSDEEGKYTLHLPQELESDTLQFSLVGYKSSSTTVNVYKAKYSSSNVSFFLEENMYNLSEVVIKPKNIVTEKTGNIISKIKPKDCALIFDLLDSIMIEARSKDVAKNKYQKAFPEKHIEVGTYFTIKKQETFIEKVQLQFCAGDYDSLKLRLNIYSNISSKRLKAVIKSFPKYENILKTPIYFTIKRNSTLVEIDLTPYSISVTDDFIVSFETLKAEDYKKINIPVSGSLAGEVSVINFSSKMPFAQIPLMKIGCAVTLSYEKKGTWFTNLFD